LKVILLSANLCELWIRWNVQELLGISQNFDDSNIFCVNGHFVHTQKGLFLKQNPVAVPRVCFYQALAHMIHFADAELCFDSEKGLEAKSRSATTS